MKLVNNLIFALTTLTLGLVACTSELEHTTPDAEVSSQKVHIVVGASRENQGIQSRTELTENQGSLDCQWSDGDKILVTDESGKLKGILDLKEFKNEKKDYAYFEGDLRGVSSGKVTFNYYYVGTKLSASEEELKKLVSPYTHDFSVQDGLFSSLTDYDLLSAQANTIIADGKSYVDIYLQRRISAAHFTLNNLPDNFEGDVQISGAGIRNVVSLPFTQHKAETSANPNPCTITLQNVGKDFYMILLPNDVSEGFDMTFSTTFNGTNYEGTYHVSKAIGEAKYYRKALGDGTYGGLPVEMTSVEPAKNYQIIYCIEVKGIDNADSRVCESIPYNVTGNEYRVLNFTEVQRNTAATQEKDADFVEGYFADFLGWGTDPSAEHSWTAAGYGADYVAEETGDNKENNGVIDFTELSDDKFTEVEENGKTYQQLKLYAKGSFMKYTLILVVRPTYDESSSSENRNTGWIDYKISYSGVPTKPKHKFMGWTRHDQEGKEIDRANPLQTGKYVHIEKGDKYGEWIPDEINKAYPNHDYPDNEKLYKGHQILRLYPVWEPLSTVTTDGYGHGDW